MQGKHNYALTVDLISAATIALYSGSFQRFYYVGSKVLAANSGSDGFSLRLARGLLRHFGTVTGTLGSFKRSSPSNVKFAQLFFKENDGGFNANWWKVVDVVESILDWVSSSQFDGAMMEQVLKTKKEELGSLHLDLAEFRLTTIVQLCLMSGTIVAINKTETKNIQYPITGLGAEKQLKVPKEKRSSVLDFISQEFAIEEFGRDGPECCLCESEDKRLTKVFNQVIKGQDLFYLFADGRYGVKLYGRWSSWADVVTGAVIVC